jgi:hypothetical protein
MLIIMNVVIIIIIKSITLGNKKMKSFEITAQCPHKNPRIPVYITTQSSLK